MASSLLLPRSVRLALWGNAWARGSVSLDDAVDRARGDDVRHLVARPGADPETLILSIAELWRTGPAVALLPLPGFLEGLGGPADFNAAAVEAGECVVVGTSGLVPTEEDGVVTWTVTTVNPSRHTETLREATSGFREALQATARALAHHDLDAVRDEVRDALVDIDSPVHLELPVDLGTSVERTLASALRCYLLTPAALDDHRVDLSSSAASLRREALRPLDHAARRVLAAASASGPRG